MKMKFLKPTTFLCLATTISSTLITPVFADSKEVNYDINNMNTKYHNNDLITKESYSKDEILKLEPYIFVDENGLFSINSEDALNDGFPKDLVEGQQQYFEYLNSEVKSGNIKVSNNLNITGMTSIQKEYENAIKGDRCNRGRNTSMATHWWGVSRYTCDHNTSIMAGEFLTVSGVAGGIGLIGKWFPGVSVPAGITASYFKLLSGRINANNKGRGVLTEISWAFVFDITPQ